MLNNQAVSMTIPKNVLLMNYQNWYEPKIKPVAILVILKHKYFTILFVIPVLNFLPQIKVSLLWYPRR